MVFLKNLMKALGISADTSRESVVRGSDTTKEQNPDTPEQEIACPRCGYTMKEPDWRCPKCYCEFANYNFDTGTLTGEPIAAKQKGRANSPASAGKATSKK